MTENLPSFVKPFLIYLCFCVGLFTAYVVIVFGVLGIFHTYSPEYQIFFMPINGADPGFITAFEAEGFWSAIKEVYHLTLSLDTRMSPAVLFERGVLFCSALGGMTLILVAIGAVISRISEKKVSLTYESEKEWSDMDLKEKCLAAFMFPITFGAAYLTFTPAYFFGFWGLVTFWGALMLYMLPSIISEKHHNYSAITVLNVLLGWTVIGWIVALIWALTKPQSEVNSDG